MKEKLSRIDVKRVLYGCAFLNAVHDHVIELYPEGPSALVEIENLINEEGRVDSGVMAHEIVRELVDETLSDFRLILENYK